MTNRALVCSLALLVGAAVAVSGGDRLKYTMTFTGAEGGAWSMQATGFEFQSEGRTLTVGTPSLYQPHDDELLRAPVGGVDLLVTKTMDKSSAKLGQAMESRTVFPSVKLALMGSVGDKRIQVTYELKNVMVSRVAPAEGTESLTLNFAEITVTY